MDDLLSGEQYTPAKVTEPVSESNIYLSKNISNKYAFASQNPGG
jgi:hypothetical protein